MKRIITLLLAVLMVAGTLATSVSARTYKDPTLKQEVTIGYEDYLEKSFNEIYQTYLKDEEGDPFYKYLSEGWNFPYEKLDTMVKVYEKDGYELYYEYYTGEVACIDTRTGQSLFTNPYDISAMTSTASQEVKKQLFSQLIIQFLDNGQTKTFNSYTEAAVKNQILLKNIKNGIRVEYTIGDEATTRLVPRMITKERFEKLIMSKVVDAPKKVRDRLSGGGYWVLYDISDESYSESKVRQLLEKWPILEKFPIYFFDDSKLGYLTKAEQTIKNYCPEYSYDDLEYDHELTGYTGNDAAPPLFKMALEYSIEDNGLNVRLPANGIRFDESMYQLTSVSVLPYMGAGSKLRTGYTFIPDGSGALIRFEDITNTYNISGEMYGADYSYHEIVGQHAEVMRYPVFGVVTDYDEGTEGYVGIITEGDSMAKVLSTHGGNMHNWNSVYASFNPRPYDSYELSGGATWTVTSSRRYTGSYTIRYMMLNDNAAKNGDKGAYEANYVGMAKAYRDYLTTSGQLTRLTKDDVQKDLPIYIESFGSMQTDDRFLSIPIKVDTPITTFEDVKTMYDQLAEKGVTNVNFKLTGFANGGLDYTAPYKLEWMRVLGGSSGFKDLVNYANEKKFGIYPDFDFTYIQNDTSFDGLSLKKHAVRTIDNRYTSKRYYDAATQTWNNDFALAISPSVYEYLYGGLSSHLDDYELKGISAGTLGTELNSDFDKSDPYNREDAKAFTQDILGKMQEKYSVMVNGGNAYTFKNADIILGMATESSKYVKSSASVPFIGMVLHGYLQTAGTAFNMEGDVESALLHAIENGSNLYFYLSYRNTELLKESVAFSDYYSVGYDVWKEELVEYYNELNDAIGDLQTVLISGHHFIDAERIPDADELEADEAQAKLEADVAAQEKAEAKAKADLEKKRIDRLKALGQYEGGSKKDDDSGDEDEEIEDEEDEDDEGGGIGFEIEEEVSKYATSDGTVIVVEYENGTSFILNYNSFAIKAAYNGQNYEIDSLGYVRIDG